MALVVCIAAAGGLGVLLAQGDGDDDTAEPTPTRTTTPTPTQTTPSPTPIETTPSPTPTIERTAAVSVLNNTSIQGLAARFSTEVQQKGWTVGGVGDWNGQIASNTVYYPPALEEQAQLLAQDMGIERVRPAVAPMRTDRLTIILSGPQQ